MYINGKLFHPKRYSSGEMKLIRSELDSYIVNNEITLLYLNEESIFELFILIDYYKKSCNKINLILSYLPYQRMDHANRDELNTVENVANIINGLNLNSVTICEPHTNIDSFKKANAFSYIHNLKDRVFAKINFDNNTDTIVLSDKGGVEKFGNLANNIV